MMSEETERNTEHSPSEEAEQRSIRTAELRSSDVLFGGFNREWRGNKLWGLLAESKAEEYRQLATDEERAVFAHAVVEAVQARGGRFLENDPRSGLWSEAGLERSIEMTETHLTEKAGRLSSGGTNAYLQQESGPPKQQSAPPTAPFWCDVCRIDLQSYKSLEEHKGGKKHRNKLARQGAYLAANSTPAAITSSQPQEEGYGLFCELDNGHAAPRNEQPTSSQSNRHYYDHDVVYPCYLCKKYFESSALREYHYHHDREHIKMEYKEYYEHEGVEVDDAIVEEIYRQEEMATDVNLAHVEDGPRMLQNDFDDAVVEVALYKYELFHNMEHGKATFTMVNETSAGILGWAASAVGDETSETHVAYDAEADAKLPASTTNQHNKTKGDEEEARMLRLAMMESMLESTGVCLPTHEKAYEEIDYYQSDDDDDNGEEDDDEEQSYQYDDDDDDDDDDDEDDYRDEDNQGNRNDAVEAPSEGTAMLRDEEVEEEYSLVDAAAEEHNRQEEDASEADRTISGSESWSQVTANGDLGMVEAESTAATEATPSETIDGFSIVEAPNDNNPPSPFQVGSQPVLPAESCVLEILPEHIFHRDNPVIVGVRVDEGVLTVGAQLCVSRGTGLKHVGMVQSMVKTGQDVDKAEKGDVIVVRIDNWPGISYGEAFGAKDKLYSSSQSLP